MITNSLQQMTPTGEQEFQHHPIIASETGIQQSYKTTPSNSTYWERNVLEEKLQVPP